MRYYKHYWQWNLDIVFCFRFLNLKKFKKIINLFTFSLNIVTVWSDILISIFAQALPTFFGVVSVFGEIFGENFRYWVDGLVLLFKRRLWKASKGFFLKLTNKAIKNCEWKAPKTIKFFPRYHFRSPIQFQDAKTPFNTHQKDKQTH